MEKVYTDEPIGCSREERGEDIPERLAGFVDYLERGPSVYGTEGRAFAKAALIMADYEDERPYDGERISGFRTYSQLSLLQLRGYFAWRTAFRKGEAGPSVHQTYTFIFACETVNGIGWSDPERGYELLLRALGFFDDGRGAYPYISWLDDFAACYGIDDPLHRRSQSIATLIEDIHSADPGVLLEAFSEYARYPLGSKRTFQSHPAEFAETFKEALLIYDSDLSDGGLRGLATRRRMSTYYHMFPCLLYYDPHSSADVNYDIPGVAEYERRRGVWTKTFIEQRVPCPRPLRSLIRAVDAVLRERFAIRPFLKALDENDEKMLGIASAASADRSRHDAEESSTGAGPFCGASVDPGDLRRIRADSERIMERIMTADERPDPVPDPVPESSHSGVADDLTADEIGFLRKLISGDAIGGSGERPWQVVCDSINTKLYDRFADNVIDILPDGPVLVEDYVNDLSGILSL